MKRRHAVYIWLISSVLLLSIAVGAVSFAPSPSQVGQAQDDGDETETEPLVVLNENNIKQATVFIMQVSDRTGQPVIHCVGSGTLVSSDGLILTNAHLARPTRDCEADRLVIALTIRIDEPPVPTYVAEPVEVSTGYDLAVLRITAYLDGRVIEPASLQLPFVELGNSSQAELDETIHVFGYPDIVNQVVQVQRGTISGFTAEARVGERAWMRTTATIPGLMSGGGAFNRDGQLIGIPTIMPERVAGTIVDCRQVYDTNGDNQVDDSDACIPIGGPISAIRPVRLAVGLVRAASLGIQPGAQRSQLELPPPTEPPEISNVFVATGVNEAGMPISVVQAAPTGIQSLYLFFDYRNMVDGMIYELRTTIDGRPRPNYSLPPVAWSGGQQGLWHIGSTVAPQWPVGQYEFTLFVEGRQVASYSFQVGVNTSSQPQFSDLSFGLESALEGIVGTGFVVPETNIIRARFNFRNMQPGMNWRFQWYLEGVPLAGEGGGGDIVWEREEAQGVHDDLAISSEAGFVSGAYRLALFMEIEGEYKLAAMSDFVVAGGAGGANDAEAQIFSNFRFAQEEQGNTPLGLIAEDFAEGVPAVYVFFDWRQISPGTPWTWRWLVDGEVLIEESTQWSVEANGENYFFSLVGNPLLPDARYTFEIEINGIPMTQDVEAGVGLGQLRPEIFESAEGVQMTGRITDAETGEGVPGAMFIVLLAEFDTEDFAWNNNQVLGRAQADRNGFFQIPVLLPRGTLEEPVLYSVVVAADGYFLVSTDGIPVTDATRSPLVVDVELSRD